MKIPTFLVRSLTLAAGLCAASNIVNASVADFSDTWKDAATLDTDNGTYTNKTTGAFSVDISLPGVVSSSFDTKTAVSLSLFDGQNPGGPVTIFAGKLGDDQNYTVKAKSATFPIVLAGGVTNGSVTVSWTATTVTVKGSSGVDLLGEEALYSSTVKSNFNLGAITLTVDSTANPAGMVFTYANALVPVAGKNTTTQETKTNLDGSMTAMEAGSISAVADFTLPKLAVAYPANNSRIGSGDPVIAMHGTTSDYYGITSVEWYVNGGAAVPVDNSPPAMVPSLAWAATVDLMAVGQLGTNVITVFAINSLGLSNAVSETVILVSNNAVMVQVSPTNTGTIKGLKNKEMVQMGNGYPVSATPSSQRYIFSQWTDGEGTVLLNPATGAPAGPSFDYQANTGNNTLVADFLPNPFYDTGLAGIYEGGFFDTNGVVAPTNAGYLTVTVTPNATYTGRLSLPSTDTSFGFSGQLALPAGSLVAMAESKITVSKSLDLDVQLTIAVDTDLTDFGTAGMMGGMVNATSYLTNALWGSSNYGVLAMDVPYIVPGVYNVVISPSGDPSAGPGGFSFATATVSKTGGVVLAITLADGTTPLTTFSTSIGLGGICPVYAALYGGKGVFGGYLQFATNGTASVANGVVPLAWVKSPVKDKFYTNGFAYNPTVVAGGLYESLNIFDWTAGNLDFDMGYAGFTLADDIGGGVAITYNPAKNTLVDPTKRDKVTITLVPKTGALSGSSAAATFNLQTNTIATPTFHGLALSAGNGDGGWGYYVATNQVPNVGLETGPVTILPAP